MCKRLFRHTFSRPRHSKTLWPIIRNTHYFQFKIWVSRDCQGTLQMCSSLSRNSRELADIKYNRIYSLRKYLILLQPLNVLIWTRYMKDWNANTAEAPQKIETKTEQVFEVICKNISLNFRRGKSFLFTNRIWFTPVQERNILLCKRWIYYERCEETVSV